jgi:hypothetical protein
MAMDHATNFLFKGKLVAGIRSNAKYPHPVSVASIWPPETAEEAGGFGPIPSFWRKSTKRKRFDLIFRGFLGAK